MSNGHGRYMELPDQPAFFEATKKSKVKNVARLLFYFLLFLSFRQRRNSRVAPKLGQAGSRSIMRCTATKYGGVPSINRALLCVFVCVFFVFYVGYYYTTVLLIIL